MDLYRTNTRGAYDTDFSILNAGHFPSSEVKARNNVYSFRYKQFNGSYGNNKKLIAMVDGNEVEIPYNVISLNYFALLTNKMCDCVFNNEVIIKTGDINRDKEVNALVERLNWINSVRKAFKLATIYGDSVIKTYVGGASVFSPINCFKVVDIHDVNKVLGYVSNEKLLTNVGGVRYITHIRFEINIKGKVFEQVKEYHGDYKYGTVGKAVEYEYRGRTIPADGAWYDTGVDDCELIQWCSINQEADGVYGESLYQNIQDIIFAMEQRLSSENHVLHNLEEPFLIVGMSMVKQDQRTGEYVLKKVNDKYMISDGTKNEKPEFITPDYKLENSEKMLDILGNYFYELSEMGRTFLTGEYSGQVSEESLNNMIKQALDKANRVLSDMYYSFRDSLYVLCRLNKIEINKEDITINFNIGRTDDDEKVANIANMLVTNGLLSKATIREKYYGYNKEQSIEEEIQIEKEKSLSNQQLSNNDKQDNEIIVTENKIESNKTKEDKQNEME